MTNQALRAPAPENASPLQLALTSKNDGLAFLASARASMAQLIDILSRETTLLRAGQSFKAADLSQEKTTITQAYFQFVRAIQHNADLLNRLVPDELRAIRDSHQGLITQLSDNLRVIATAKTLSQDILNSVSSQIGQTQSPQTYGASGRMGGNAQPPNGGLAINRAL